jgi:Ribosomal protein L7/L12 C-terminal domain
MLYWLSAGYALAGAGWITFAVLQGPDYVLVMVGGLWILLAGSWFVMARDRRRREQRGYDQVLPGSAAEIQALLAQGRKIQAIKRYRELHPGIGLKEAKDAVDRL